MVDSARIRRAAAFLGRLSPVLALLGAGAAPAQAPVVDSQRIIQSLRPSAAAQTRGLRVAARTSPDADRKVSLDIRFANNSNRLTAAANTQLGELGAALASPQLADGRFQIAGHTSATGGAEHNRRLSEARAQAVRSYLLTHFHIAPERLQAVGFGAARPLPDFPPDALEQRRVEISTLPK